MNFTTAQQIRVDVLSKYLSSQITTQDALDVLQIKERQFRRIVKAFKEDGIQSVIHGNKGRSPVNKTSDYKINRLLKLYRERYNGLNIVHFREKLVDHLEKVPSYSTIRKILLQEKLVSPMQKRTKRVHKMRKRYQREGLMIQIDGSHHHWIMGRSPCCLTLTIDDATGKLLAGKFTETETTFAAMDVVEKIIKEKGCFQMLYSDKAGIYGGGKRNSYTQMNRALSEIGILSIQASSPQAKGRIERVFRTLQSRLVSELRLAGVRTLEEATSFLEKVFIPSFNKKFAVCPKITVPFYKALGEEINLNEVFCFIDTRVVGNGDVISYNNRKILLKTIFNTPVTGKQVEIKEYRDGSMKIFYQDVEVEFEEIVSDKVAA